MAEPVRQGGPYRWYVLGLLTLVYAFNFIDRQIVTILAPSLKAGLGLTDAQLGLLYGTAFALFYALFGLPLARLADEWHRVRTLAIGLGFWSAMTAVSGMAGSFAQLAGARVGVGVGEASAGPAAFSLLQDYFARGQRATALALYSSGIYIGVGASLMIGGGIVAAWDGAYAAGAAPFGLAGWQAAYLAVGSPGLVLALLVALTVREPARAASPARRAFRSAVAELATMIPPFSLFALRRLGADRRTLAANLLALAGSIAGAAILIPATDAILDPAKRPVVATIAGLAITTNVAQWVAIAIGVYATVGWVQAVRLRDPVTASLLTGTPGFVALAIGGGVLSMAGYGLSAFMFLYGKTYLGLTAADGFTLGAISAVAGGGGTALGGIIADAWRRRHPAGRIHVAIAAATVSGLCSIVQYTAGSVPIFYVACFASLFSLTMWLGPIMASGQDQVLPRMRGTATALQFLGLNLIGLGLGPYTLGLVSDATGSLRTAILAMLGAIPVAVALFLYAARRLPDAEATLAARARAAGEPG